MTECPIQLTYVKGKFIGSHKLSIQGWGWIQVYALSFPFAAPDSLAILLLSALYLPTPKACTVWAHERDFSNLCLPRGFANGEEGAKGRSGCLFPWLPPCRVTSGWLCPPIQGHCFSLSDSPLQVMVTTPSPVRPLRPAGDSSSSYWPWVLAEFCAQCSLAPYTLPTVNGPFIKPVSSASELSISCWPLSLMRSLMNLSCWDLS